MKYGFSGLNNSLNGNNNTLASALGLLSKDLNGFVVVGRVKSIILDKTHPRFQELGEWNALGYIEFDNTSVQETNRSKTGLIAKPLFPNFKNYPILNEIVYIISLPSEGVMNNSLSRQNYYFNPINVWNHPHHNAVPFFVSQTSQNKDYQQTSLGNPNKETTQIQTVNLGEGFVEKPNIHPLLPKLGDVILEGRFGNSIRFGNENGNPITIIRNGQPLDSTSEGWIPISEDINKDQSSIYQTSTQKIPINLASENFNSYKTLPISPKEYNKSQIILNSGRLIFNSKEDHIILSSQKSIGLCAVESVNINCKQEFAVDASKIFLGNKNASESVLLGDKTITLLDKLLKSIDYLATSLEGAQDWPSGQPAPSSTIRNAATSTKEVIKSLSTELTTLKSKIVKTI